MAVFIYAAALVAVSFVVHVVVWRLALPRAEMRAILLIFVGVTVIGLGLALAGMLPRLGPVEALHVGLAALAVALAYACLYSAIESPTVALIRFTAAAGAEGRARDDYRTIINDDLLIGARFRAMQESGLVERLEDETYRLTARGQRLARGFAAASRVFGVSGAG